MTDPSDSKPGPTKPDPSKPKYDPATDPARTLYKRRVYPSIAERDLSFLKDRRPFDIEELRENARKQREMEAKKEQQWKNARAYVRKDRALSEANEVRIRAHLQVRAREYAEALLAVIAEEADRPASAAAAPATGPIQPTEPIESTTPTQTTDPNQTECRAIWWQDDLLHVATAPFRQRKLYRRFPSIPFATLGIEMVIDRQGGSWADENVHDWVDWIDMQMDMGFEAAREGMVNDSAEHVWRHAFGAESGLQEMAGATYEACLRTAGFPEQGSVTELVMGSDRNSPWLYNPDSVKPLG